MKNLLLMLALWGVALHGSAQNPPGFYFETNKTLCVLHFMHTAIGGEHSSPSYRTFIEHELANDEQFSSIIQAYKELNFSAGYRKPGLPRRRFRSRTVMDFLWLQATASENLDDFSKRTIGLLSVADHASLFRVLAKAEEYYERLVWNPQLENIAQTEKFLKAFEDRVGLLFNQVAGFYGTPWPSTIPFTVALCPIPLSAGITSAVPKVNTLVCSYLSENKEEYKATLGVAVHEMCHSVYDEQPAELQQQIDDWFTLSKRSYAPYAYNYFNEGLATAIGNGWAYEQLNGKLDSNPWYADDYIDGFARALFPLVKAYLNEHQAIDRPFIDAAIEAFAKTFPNANRDLSVLFRSVGIYADSENEELLGKYTDELVSRFRVSSSFLRAPITSAGALRTMKYPHLTKLIIIDQDREERWEQLGQHFEELSATVVPHETNCAYSFYDFASKSPVIVLLIENEIGLSKLLDFFKAKPLINFSENVALGGAVDP